MSKPKKSILRGSSYDEYICIRNFMSAEGGLGLSGIKAQVYALIYSHSPADTLANETGCYFGSISYTAARIGAGRSTTIDALKWLLKSELIVEKGEHIQGDSSTTKKYIINRERAIAAQQQFKNYWDACERECNQEIPPHPETVPEGILTENSDFSRPETVPDASAPRPETVPENLPVLKFSAPRPETVPESGSSRPEIKPDHVQKSDPIVKGYKPLRSLESFNSYISSPPEPSVGGMEGGSVDQEIKADLDPEILSSVKALMARSLNRKAPLDEVLEAYKYALDVGYTPELIFQGYEKYIERYKLKNPNTTAYAIRLSNYLTRGDGLRFDLHPQKKSRRTTRPVTNEANRREIEEQEYLEKYSEYWDAYQAIPKLVKDRFEAMRSGASTQELETITKSFDEAQSNLRMISKRLLNEREVSHGR